MKEQTCLHNHLICQMIMWLTWVCLKCREAILSIRKIKKSILCRLLQSSSFLLLNFSCRWKKAHLSFSFLPARKILVDVAPIRAIYEVLCFDFVLYVRKSMCFVNYMFFIWYIGYPKFSDRISTDTWFDRPNSNNSLSTVNSTSNW